MHHVRSPLNYAGGKYRVIGQLTPLIPETQQFVDVFCGGLTVSLNVKAARYHANDLCPQLIDLYQTLQNTPEEESLARIDDLINRHQISKTNRQGFLDLREEFNSAPDAFRLMVLVSNSFNYQMRFNSRCQFNMPFGKDRSYFSPRMRQNLVSLIRFLRCNDVTLTCGDFRELKVDADSFLYADPPYSMSDAVYNAGWSAEDDLDLCRFLQAHHEAGGKFMLSCLLSHRGITNETLDEFSKRHTTHQVAWTHANANYQKADKHLQNGNEVCITNY